MINLYNPFKPHVVLFNNGKFGVRKLGFWFCWRYLDQTTSGDGYWWNMEECIIKYAQADSFNKLRRSLTSKYYKE